VVEAVPDASVVTVSVDVELLVDEHPASTSPAATTPVAVTQRCIPIVRSPVR
jgi:hypothetical protein